MKVLLRKPAAVKKQPGKKQRKSVFYPLIYVDIETSYTEGDKPFIGQICILDSKSNVLLNHFFEDPREITKEQIKEILELLYTHYAVWCDPTEDLHVIRHDARRCGVKLKKSKLKMIDIQLVEHQVTKKNTNRRLSLIKLAHKYNVKPSVKFHDPYSDALAAKEIFEEQLKQLNIDKEHLYKLDQLS